LPFFSPSKRRSTRYFDRLSSSTSKVSAFIFGLIPAGRPGIPGYGQTEECLSAPCIPTVARSCRLLAEADENAIQNLGQVANAEAWPETSGAILPGGTERFNSSLRATRRMYALMLTDSEHAQQHVSAEDGHALYQ
jgi:hypothetical protein